MRRYGYSVFSDVVLPTLTVVSLVTGVVTFAAQTTEARNHNDCHFAGELAQVDVTYRKWDGCFVKQNNSWVPLSIWRYNREHGIDMSKLGD